MSKSTDNMFDRCARCSVMKKDHIVVGPIDAPLLVCPCRPVYLEPGTAPTATEADKALQQMMDET